MPLSKKRAQPSTSSAPCAVGALVFPGDELCALDACGDVIIGRGVVRDGAILRACLAGVLLWEAPRRRLWVECERKRYIPCLGEHIIGVVLEKHAEEYRVHIGGAAAATLPVLAFDGATKRNRPHLEVGTLVYARVALAHRDTETEISCAAPHGIGAKDWVTKESVFGELAGGQLFQSPLSLCRRLMSDECSVLAALAAVAPFELAVGANGRVWLSSAAAAAAVVGQCAILRSPSLPDAAHAELVASLADAFGVDADADAAGAR